MGVEITGNMKAGRREESRKGEMTRWRNQEDRVKERKAKKRTLGQGMRRWRKVRWAKRGDVSTWSDWKRGRWRREGSEGIGCTFALLTEYFTCRRCRI